MSKFIKIPEDKRAECEAAISSLLAGRLLDGEVRFTRSFNCGENKAVVRFEPAAFYKMWLLLENFDKEVAWHSVMRRGNEDENEYIVEDILVYPQEVTAATVDMDEIGYTKWKIDGLKAGDDRFNHLNLQGHSHVNMGTSPSGTDLGHQNAILDMLGPDDFYCFMIYNKSMKHTNVIYDMKKNIKFEDSDIKITLTDMTSFDDFLNDAKSQVKNRVYQYSSTAKTSESTQATTKPGESTASGAKKDEKQTQSASKITELNPPKKDKPASYSQRNYSGSYYDDDGYDCYGQSYYRRYS